MSISTSTAPQFGGFNLKNYMLEGPRSIKEAVKTKLNYADLVAQAPKGKMQPVLVMPGFMATDVATKPLRQFLKDINYCAYATRAGRNVPFNKKASIDYFVKRVEDIYAKNKQPVALVGWSLGGIQAREVAKLIPDKVSQVITMGSPVNHKRSKVIVRGGDEFMRTASLPTVPTTVIYSDADGIVDTEYAEQVDSTANNVAVYAPHMAMPRSTEIYKAVANTLANERSK